MSHKNVSSAASRLSGLVASTKGYNRMANLRANDMDDIDMRDEVLDDYTVADGLDDDDGVASMGSDTEDGDSD